MSDSASTPNVDHRLFNPVQLFVLVILLAGITLFIVSNVLRVRSLVQDINTLRYTRDSLVSTTNLLRNEVLSLQSSARINRIAHERLGLSQPAVAPIVIEDKESKP